MENNRECLTLVTVKEENESLQDASWNVNETLTKVSTESSIFGALVKPDSKLLRDSKINFELLPNDTACCYDGIEDNSFAYSELMTKDEVKSEYDLETDCSDGNEGAEGATISNNVEQFINEESQLCVKKEAKPMEDEHSDNLEQKEQKSDTQENGHKSPLAVQNYFNVNDSLQTKCELRGPYKRKRLLEKKIFKCDLCDYRSSQQSALKKHTDVVHLKLKRYKCEYCEFSARWKGTIRIHTTAIHLKLKSHKCKECDYTTTEKVYLKRHVDCVHLKIKKYKCEHCDHTTSLKASLNKHVATIHTRKGRYVKKKSKPKPLKPHQCHFCDFSTKLKKYLRSHINHVHETSGNYKCAHCEYSAPRPSTIKTHTETVHLKLKKHICNLCDFKSSRISNVKIHVRKVHTNNDTDPDSLAHKVIEQAELD